MAAKHKKRRTMHFRHPKYYENLKRNSGSKGPELVTSLKPAAGQPGLQPASYDIDPWRHKSANMSCRTCMWFNLKKGEVGRCRRRSPSPDGSIGWPVVFKNDWCGNHKLDENTQ